MTKTLNRTENKNKGMKQQIILIFIIFSLLSVSLVSGEIATLGGENGFPKGSTIRLEQTNPECSYMNLDSVNSESETYTINENMTLIGNTYYYNFSNTSEMGEYRVKTCCDGGIDNETICEIYNFYVNQTGSKDEQTFYSVFIIIAILLGILFFILSFIYDEKLFIFSAIGFIGAGIMTLYFPFGNNTSFITNAISILLNGIGMVIIGVYVIKDWF